MDNVSRRQFMAGLAVLGASGWTLRADAQPTPATDEAEEFVHFLYAQEKPEPAKADKLGVTEDCILGPYHRPGAPYRAKITPPHEAGIVLVISGRVWGHDTKKPLAGAKLDVWQANAKGRYDNDDPKNPPKKDVFVNRARLVADENGSYEYETVHPGPYKIGEDAWRPSHIHYIIAHPGYKSLTTQLFFKGDPHNATDEFIKQSLIIEVEKKKVGENTYEVGMFDIVLAAAK
jgi:catechol 1,2-dioxygenase